MDRDDILDRVLYGYFLEQLFSVATGRLDKLFSVVSIIRFGNENAVKAPGKNR